MRADFENGGSLDLTVKPSQRLILWIHAAKHMSLLTYVQVIAHEARRLSSNNDLNAVETSLA